MNHKNIPYFLASPGDGTEKSDVAQIIFQEKDSPPIDNGLALYYNYSKSNASAKRIDWRKTTGIIEVREDVPPAGKRRPI